MKRKAHSEHEKHHKPFTMSDSTPFNITISASELQNFYQDQLNQSQDIHKTHHALITLSSFISTFGLAAQDIESYQEIVSAIKAVIDKSQQMLLEKSTEELVTALRQCNIAALTAVHTSLRGHDFYTVLEAAITELSDDDIRLVMIWSDNWVKEAKEMATEASETPDTMDFSSADIKVEEYHAISNIDRVFNP